MMRSRSSFILIAQIVVLATTPVLASSYQNDVTFADIEAARANLKEAQKEYNHLIASLYDSDEEDPPGPPGGFPHTQPFTTTETEQLGYSEMVEEEVYAQYQDLYFQAYGGKEAHKLHITPIARPENSTTGYYTGVTHFHHVHNTDLVTFLFSAGRHDGGTNTMLTIDTTKEGNPFEGAQETFINATDISTWTWASTHTVIGSNGTVQHYALFAGGVGEGVTGPSKLYVFEENPNGSLKPPKVAWEEDTFNSVAAPARFGILADLQDIYINGTQMSAHGGVPCIIITGTNGLDIHASLNGTEWNQVRSFDRRDFDNDVGAYLGVAHLGKYLIVTARALWGPNVGKIFNAPNVVYDYVNDVIVQQFSPMGQKISAAVLDDGARVFIGAGGQAGLTGQPNMLFDATYVEQEALGQRSPTNHTERGETNANATNPENSTLHLVMADPQLALGTPLMYTPYEVDESPIILSHKYFVVPAPGNTQTRQVLPFKIHDKPSGEPSHSPSSSPTPTSAGKSGKTSKTEKASTKDASGKTRKLAATEGTGEELTRWLSRSKAGKTHGTKTEMENLDLVLEVNSGQTSNIYYRTSVDLPASKVMPLPGSQGDETELWYARAGDTLVIRDTLYVILAMYNGNNTVWSFSTDVF